MEEEGIRAEIDVFVLVAEPGVVRCLPACTRRMDVVGADVRSERRWRRVGIVVSDGTVRGIAETVLVHRSTCEKILGGKAYCLQKEASQRSGSSRMALRRMTMTRSRKSRRSVREP